jgi:cephalosporin hydroxylase
MRQIIDAGYELGMIQNRYEIENAVEFVKNLNIKNFMEIGTNQGGTFYCWSKICAEDGLKISVDWTHEARGGTANFNIEDRNNVLKGLGSNVHIINGDSHSEDIYQQVKAIIGDEKLDFLFIDGDHSHLGVKLDYHMYKEFVKKGGWIGFHDIKSTEMHHEQGCYVDYFWDELNNEKAWFITDNDWGGIGMIKI